MDLTPAQYAWGPPSTFPSLTDRLALLSSECADDPPYCRWGVTCHAHDSIQGAYTLSILAIPDPTCVAYAQLKRLAEQSEGSYGPVMYYKGSHIHNPYWTDALSAGMAVTCDKKYVVCTNANWKRARGLYPFESVTASEMSDRLPDMMAQYLRSSDLNLDEDPWRSRLVWEGTPLENQTARSLGGVDTFPDKASNIRPLPSSEVWSEPDQALWCHPGACWSHSTLRDFVSRYFESHHTARIGLTSFGSPTRIGLWLHTT
jgi:hypothetical protein